MEKRPLPQRAPTPGTPDHVPPRQNNQCKLFTKVRATLASSFAHINVKKKGNTLYHPNGVVGVITGHGNTKVALDTT